MNLMRAPIAEEGPALRGEEAALLRDFPSPFTLWVRGPLLRAGWEGL